jgi:hypothetical protein
MYFCSLATIVYCTRSGPWTSFVAALDKGQCRKAVCRRYRRSGRVSDCKPDNLGSRPGSAAFETFQLCRSSSTFVKCCQKSSIFIVKFSSGMSETFFDTCVNWSCVTRCRCRTTSSTLFTVYKLVACLLAIYGMAALWVQIQTYLKIYKWAT